MHQLDRARHYHNALLVVRLVILNFAGLGVGVQMRRDALDDLNRSHAVSDGHDGISIYALARSPLPPLAVDRTRGVCQNSVQIKKNG